MRYFVFLFLFFNSFSFQAQKYSAGPVLNTKIKILYPIVVYGDNLVFKYYKSTFSNPKFGISPINQLTISKKNIDLFESKKPTKSGDYVTSDTYHLLKDGIMIFGYHYNSRLNTKDFYVQKFNQNLELEFDWKKIFQIEGKSVKSVYPEINVTSDSTGLLLVFEQVGAKKEDFQKINILEISNNGSVVKDKDFTLPYPQKYLSINHSFKFDNGKIALVTFFKSTSKIKTNIDQDENTNDNLLTFLVDMSSGSIKEFRINDGSYDGSSYICSKNKNNLTYTALLSEKIRKVYSLSGVGTLSLNSETNTISNLNPQLFDEKTIQKIIESTKGKVNKEVKGKDVIKNLFQIYQSETDPSDEGTIVTAQIHYTYQRCVTDSRGYQRCTTYYVYGDILVFKLSKNGTLIWVNVLPRNHTYPFPLSNGDIGFSFFKNNQYCVFFTDGTNNEDNKKVTKKSKSSVVFTMDTNGNMSKEIITNIKKDKMHLVEYSGLKLSDNEVILSGYQKKKWMFVKIKL